MRNIKIRGFTLIELIVVIAIIGVLAAILIPTMMGYVKKSKRASDVASAREVHTSTLDLYLKMKKRMIHFMIKIRHQSVQQLLRQMHFRIPIIILCLWRTSMERQVQTDRVRLGQKWIQCIKIFAISLTHAWNIIHQILVLS